MSKWQKLTESLLSVAEQEYFIEKSKDGMCHTENGHYCYVGELIEHREIVGCIKNAL